MEGDMLIALRLAKDGFGSPEAILNMPTNIVLAAWEYTQFCADYDCTVAELNKEGDR